MRGWRVALLLLLSCHRLPAAEDLPLPAGPDPTPFEPCPVLRIDIQLSRQAVSSLRQDMREYVRGTVREGDAVYQDVGIRLKGSAGSQRSIDDQPGFTLKFNQFLPGQRFRGQKKLLLNNCAQDPTYISELIGNELFRAAGVPAQRIGHAHVKLNGRELGLYVIAEGLTRDFLARWFKDPNGNLYEGPGEITGHIDVDSRGGQSDRADLRALAEAAGEKNVTERWARLETVLDMDRFMSFLAMEAITSHWDGYAVGVNNFHLYHDPTARKFVFIPHGMDQLFQQPDAAAVPRDSAGMVARQVLSTPMGRRLYREKLQKLLDTAFDFKTVKARVEEAGVKINRALAEKDSGRAEEHRQLVRDFVERIAARERHIREELSRPPPKPSVRFDAAGVGRVGGWKPQVTDEADMQLTTAAGEGRAGGQALKIQSGADGGGKASWRTTVTLAAGRYRLRGLIRTEGVEAARARDQYPPGVCLRLSRRQPSEKLLGTNDWTRYEFEFVVEPEDAAGDEDPPIEDLPLVCELSAQRGTAWFDEASLELVKLPSPKPADPKTR